MGRLIRPYPSGLLLDFGKLRCRRVCHRRGRDGMMYRNAGGWRLVRGRLLYLLGQRHTSRNQDDRSHGGESHKALHPSGTLYQGASRVPLGIPVSQGQSGKILQVIWTSGMMCANLWGEGDPKLPLLPA